MGRLRVFSWAEGETAPTEHPTPDNAAVGTCVAKYTVTGDERICIIGNEAGASYSSIHQAKKNHFYTLELA